MDIVIRVLFLMLSFTVFTEAMSISNSLKSSGAFSRSMRANSVHGRMNHELPNPHYLFMKKAPSPRLTVDLHDNYVLECEAGGSPPPTIHWLRDGRPVSQSLRNEENNAISEVFTPVLGIGSTKSKLFLDCFELQDQGDYTCVAETPYQKVSAKVRVSAKHSIPGQLNSMCVSTKKSIATPARITMWTGNMLENMGNDVLLFCRTLGSPNPRNTWLVNDELINNNAKYQVQENGDLLVRNIDWNDMGEYTCVAENSIGRDTAGTFLYPVKNEDD